MHIVCRASQCTPYSCFPGFSCCFGSEVMRACCSVQALVSHAEHSWNLPSHYRIICISSVADLYTEL